ncbi:unnamed protein product, partial [marine sediment metagenome]
MNSKGRVKETVESLVIAGILALIIRAFVVEAFVVPTGSMAPAIYGGHLELKCRNCDHAFAVKWGWWSKPASVTCPNCGGTIRPGMLAYSRGDRLLVNKFLHKMKGLSRWEIVVFLRPVPPRKNYIKRLVGLPGEKVRIKDGDLYIDGRIERKLPDIQEQLWITVSETDFRHDAWKALWVPGENGCEAADGWMWLLGNDSGGPSLRYKDMIDDYVTYNAGSDGEYRPADVDTRGERAVTTARDRVGDIKVSVKAGISEGSALVVDLAINDGR